MKRWYREHDGVIFSSIYQDWNELRRDAAKAGYTSGIGDGIAVFYYSTIDSEIRYCVADTRAGAAAILNNDAVFSSLRSKIMATARLNSTKDIAAFAADMEK